MADGDGLRAFDPCNDYHEPSGLKSTEGLLNDPNLMAVPDPQLLPAANNASASAAASVPAPRSPLTADRAIALCRRWLMWTTLFNVLMVGTVLAAAIIGYSRGYGAGPAILAGVVWFGVIVASVRARRLAFDAVPLIVAGDFNQAEDHLGQSLRSFSLLRSTKLLGLYQLAMLRHAESRWADAAKLCRELLDRRRAGSVRDAGEFEIQSRLMLAESLIELNDTAGAGVELLGLSTLKLDLRETLVLTQVRLDLQARLGHWRAMMESPRVTLGLIELMPTAMSARCHALLALAARKIGDETWHALLARRATLLMDTDAIVKGRPFLREAF